MARRYSKKGKQTLRPVRLDADWIARWLPQLDSDLLAAYVALASLAPTLPTPSDPQLHALLGAERAGRIESFVERLRELGLLEVIESRGRPYVHLCLVGADGVHRATATRPAIREALAEHRAMMDELLRVDAADESEALREELFARYPELRKRWLAHVEAGGDERRGWRLWLELAMLLMSRFEERYGELKREHAPLFKEVSASALRLKLEMIEQITREILAHRDALFPASGEGWIAGLPEQAFVALPLVRELARRYQVGAEQIYLNTLEALANEGLAVVELDDRGQVVDLNLASTTGLEPHEERLAFFRFDELSEREREIENLEHTLERMQSARARYRAHLIEHAVCVLADLARKRRLADPDQIASLAAERVNENLELVRHEGEHPRALVEPVSAEEIRARLHEAVGAATNLGRQSEQPGG